MKHVADDGQCLSKPEGFGEVLENSAGGGTGGSKLSCLNMGARQALSYTLVVTTDERLHVQSTY